MKGKKLSELALAATAVALFMTGCGNTRGDGGISAKVHFEGVNARTCERQGFVSLPPVECQKVPGVNLTDPGTAGYPLVRMPRFSLNMQRP